MKTHRTLIAFASVMVCLFFLPVTSCAIEYGDIVMDLKADSLPLPSPSYVAEATSQKKVITLFTTENGRVAWYSDPDRGVFAYDTTDHYSVIYSTPNQYAREVVLDFEPYGPFLYAARNKFQNPFYIGFGRVEILKILPDRTWETVGTIPRVTPQELARVGKHLWVSAITEEDEFFWNSIQIYDVENPETPQLMVEEYLDYIPYMMMGHEPTQNTIAADPNALWIYPHADSLNDAVHYPYHVGKMTILPDQSVLIADQDLRSYTGSTRLVLFKAVDGQLEPTHSYSIVDVAPVFTGYVTDIIVLPDSVLLTFQGNYLAQLRVDETGLSLVSLHRYFYTSGSHNGRDVYFTHPRFVTYPLSGFALDRTEVKDFRLHR